MSFKMNKLSAAVAATLGVAVVGVSPAQADEILFPYVVTSGTVTTLVSTINYSDVGAVTNNANTVHYRYWYKSGANAENNTAPCAEVNLPFPSSSNDIVTFDVSGQFAGNNLGVLFEDTTVSTLPNSDKAGYGNTSFSLLEGITPPIRAYLVADNNDFDANIITRSDESMAGEAIVLEFQSGAAWGYRAYNPAGRFDANGLRNNAFQFSDEFETTGEVIAGSFVPVAIAPFNEDGGEFLTKFFVTPIAPTGGAPLLDSNFVLRGQAFQHESGRINARVQLAIRDLGLGGTAVMYNRDEGPVSGRAVQNVVCVGAVPAAAMLTEGARLQLKRGGWSNLVVGTGNMNELAPAAGGTTVYGLTNQAIVIKLEYNTEAPLKLDDDKASPTVKGITNNAIWLRRGIRESIAGPIGGPRLQLSSVRNTRNQLQVTDINVNSPTDISSSW